MTGRFDNREKARCRLKDIGAFSELDAETLDLMARMCRLRCYRPGQIVVESGEPSAFVGCVQSGILRMQKTQADGRQHIVGLLVEGDMFGQVFDGPLQFAIEAATDSEICAFERGPFEAELLQLPSLERVFLLNILNELDRARDWMIILSSQKVSGRLAGFLLFLCTRLRRLGALRDVDGGALDVQIPVGRSDVANLLGTRPESISRAFHALADAGTIALLKPDLIRIVDLAALAREAGEDDLAENANLKALAEVFRRRF